MCNNWPDFPISVERATGGLIGNTVMVCGGLDGSYVDECYSLTSEKKTLVTHMSVGRGYASSIVLNHNRLWVTGGFNGAYLLASSEYVTLTGTMPGPDLPMPLFRHAIVAINSTSSMVIGGYDENSGGYSASTLCYDHNKGEWIIGPSLMQARSYHAAGIVTDEVTNEQFVAVTGGWYYHDLNSTEILQDGEWVQGKLSNTIFFEKWGSVYGQI